MSVRSTRQQARHIICSIESVKSTGPDKKEDEAERKERNEI